MGSTIAIHALCHMGSVHACWDTPSVGIQYPLALILRPTMASLLWYIAEKPPHFPNQQVVTMVAVPPLHQNQLSDFIDTLATVQASPVYCVPRNNVTPTSKSVRKDRPGAHVAHLQASALR